MLIFPFAFASNISFH